MTRLIHFPFRSVIALSLFFAPVAANAAKIISDRTNSGKAFIIISGPIERDDARKFALELIKTNAEMVVLDSTGGSTVEAIEIGKSIRLKSVSTFVFNGRVCASACGLIWLAGSNKFLEKGARVGFHATYTNNQGERITSGLGNALVGRYLTLLNLPEKAIAFATMADPNGIIWLTPENYKTSGIDVELFGEKNIDNKIQTTPVPTITTMSMQPQNSATEVSLWKKIAGWTVIRDLTLSGNCAIYTDFERGTALRIGFRKSDFRSSYILIGNLKWESLEENKNYDLIVEFDSLGAWNLPTTGQKLNDVVFLRADFADTKFWDEFLEAKSMTVNFKGQPVASLSLSGTTEAVREMLLCQKSKPINRDDPFAKK